jgi:hypothetical protein
MLGRKNYTQDELDNGRAAIARQLEAYRRLEAAVEQGPAAGAARAALAAFAPLFFNNLTLALDRYYVYRLRVVTGKDGNPLNEVELLSDSVMNNGGTLRRSNVIKFVPDDSVTKLQIGDRVALTADEFERLSDAFFADLERKFV